MNAPTFNLDRLAPVNFAVDKEARTITGLAVPFGVVGNNGYGSYRFSKDSLDYDKVKFLLDHDWSQACGSVTFTTTDEGLVMTAKIARGARGDEALALADDLGDGTRVYDGLSIGLSNTARFEQDDNGVYDCISATVLEVSGTPCPAFKDAQVRSVAATATPTTGRNTMPDQTDAPTFDGAALSQQVADLTQRVEEMANMAAPVTPTAQLHVTEEPIYRFSGTTPAPSGFDFATDLHAAAIEGDKAALKRIQDFTYEALNGHGPKFVDTADVAPASPNQYKPDLFLGQAPVPTSPLYDFFHKGGLDSNQPFFHTKLDRANTDVAVQDHTEGVDPTDDDLVIATGATVTPSAVSGKVHITREVADRGGNPQASALVWAEFDRSFKIALETKTAALITAVAGSVTALTGTIAAGADGAVAGLAVEAGLLDLQFQADGTRFQKGFGHVDLYKALALYENSDGEKRYPIINPQNRSGVTGDKYSFVEIGGYRMSPTHSLGATSTSASNSYFADPQAVHVWNSGLQRLDKLMESVEGWDLGVFAYFAGLVYDVTGLRKIAYDPTA